MCTFTDFKRKILGSPVVLGVGNSIQKCIGPNPYHTWGARRSLCLPERTEYAPPPFQQFRRVTSIGSLPPKTLGKSRAPPQNSAETPQNPRRDPAEPSQRPPRSPLRGKFPRRASRRVRNFRNRGTPPFSVCRATPRSDLAKLARLYTFSWKKPRERVYTIGSERRVYTIEDSDPEKEKRRVSTVVVYTFFFPVPSFPLLRN